MRWAGCERRGLCCGAGLLSRESCSGFWQAVGVAKEVQSKVALPLALGIVIYPFLFGLLTLRPGYSLKSKLFSLLSSVIHLDVLVSFFHEFRPQNSSSSGLARGLRLWVLNSFSESCLRKFVGIGEADLPDAGFT